MLPYLCHWSAAACPHMEIREKRVTGSDSANALAKKADVVVAIGTRLQDFTTGSWTAFDKDAQFISLNAARHDASKHRSAAIVGDARQSIISLDKALGSYRAPDSWVDFAKSEREKCQSLRHRLDCRRGLRGDKYVKNR